MRTPLFLLIATLLISTNLFAQKKSKRKNVEEAKTYLSALLNIDTEEFFFEERFAVSAGIQGDSSFTDASFRLPTNIVSVGFAFQKEGKKNTYQEIALTKFTFSKQKFSTVNSQTFDPRVITVNGNESKLWNFAARYEFGKELLPSKSKINFGIGLAAAPRILYSSIVPLITAGFETNTLRSNLNITIVPSLTFNITDRLSILAKIIPSFLNVEFTREKIENPSIPLRLRTNSGFSSSFFDNNLITNFYIRYRISAD